MTIKLTFLEYLSSYNLIKESVALHQLNSLDELPFKLPKKMIGKGAQSKVYDHPTDLNTVIKVADMHLSQNPDHFEDIISTFINSNNPFFPKIYEIYSIENKNNSFLVLVMEKLKPISLQKMLKTHHQYFINNLGIDKEVILASHIESKYPNKSDDEKAEMLNTLIDGWKKYPLNSVIDLYFNRLFKEPYWPNIIAAISKNPKFVEAVRILNKYNVSLDIGKDNLMYRLTSVGPQLVFSDPIY